MTQHLVSRAADEYTTCGVDLDALAATRSPTDPPRVALRQVPAELVDELPTAARRIARLDAALYGLDSPAAR